MADGGAQVSAPELSPGVTAFMRAVERRNRASRVRLKLIARLERVAAYEKKCQAALDAIVSEQTKAATPRRPVGR